jgi:hypothetical protein
VVANSAKFKWIGASGEVLRLRLANLFPHVSDSFAFYAHYCPCKIAYFSVGRI